MTKRRDPVSALITALLILWMVALGRAVAAAGRRRLQERHPQRQNR
jgi:hypothetical protein